MRIVQNQTEDDAFIYWNDDPIISAELKKYGIKARMCPFSIIKKEGMIGYIADGKYTIEYPTPFNMEQESLSLRGKHNMYNSLAAGIAARISGIDDDSLRQSLSDFEGVEHRLQKVAPGVQGGRRAIRERLKGHQRRCLLVCPGEHEDPRHPHLGRKRQGQRL